MCKSDTCARARKEKFRIRTLAVLNEERHIAHCGLDKWKKVWARALSPPLSIEQENRSQIQVDICRFDTQKLFTALAAEKNGESNRTQLDRRRRIVSWIQSFPELCKFRFLQRPIPRDIEFIQGFYERDGI